MIEMLGVLAIVGGLSVGGIAGYSKAMKKFKINKTVDHVSQIATNIRTLYAQQTTYAGLSFGKAVSIGVVPDEMGTNSGAYFGTNAFGGWVEIWDYFTDGVFAIGLYDIPKQVCTVLATMDWGNVNSSGLVSMNVGEVTTNDIYCRYAGDRNSGEPINYCTNQEPITVAQAASACNNETRSNYGITFIFK